MFPVGVVAVHVPFAKVNVVSILAWAANVADVNVAAGCTDAVMLAMLCCVAGALGVAIVVSRCHAVLSGGARIFAMAGNKDRQRISHG